MTMVAVGVKDAPGITVTGAGVVAAAVTGVPSVGVSDAPVGVMAVPVVAVVGVAGVPVTASAVFATAVCVPKSATIFRGSCPAGNGETNRPVGIKVGVARGNCE